jgi:putative transposase
MKRKRPTQHQLPFRTWGGKRDGAGRKRMSPRGRVPHRARPAHSERHPVHVTLRASPRIPSLRKQRLFEALRGALSRTARSWFRVVQFSVQSDHVHLLVEASDKIALSRGVVGLCVRLARAVNRVVVRRGSVWGDRYHARPLTTPREVRHAIVYVITNWYKHVPGAAGLDPCSSAPMFDGWKTPPASGAPPVATPAEAPIRRAETWLASKGWKRLGLIALSEGPRGAL